LAHALHLLTRPQKKEVNMKNVVARILSVGIAMIGIAALHAQDRTVTANIPFAFYAGSTAMPEGAYRVEALSGGGVMYLRATEKGVSASKAITSWTMNASSKDDGKPPRLVFHRYGDVYFLSQIWTGNGSLGHGVAVTQREKELERNGVELSVIRIVLH
jgi:hypothetical protein